MTSVQGFRPFALERLFDKHEFSAPHLLCCSDCQPITTKELLAHADADSLHRWENLQLCYSHAKGLPALREAIAATYASSHITASDLIVLAPQEGIFLAMKALLKEGDHLVCTFPAYQSLYEVALSMGCEVSRWECTDELTFEVSDLKKLLRHDTTLVIANFPHNPTGYLPSQSDYREMHAAAQAVGARWFADEIYRGLEDDVALRLPAAATINPRAVGLGGVSKAYGLPGLRIGWLTCRDPAFLERVTTLRDYTTICCSTPSEVLALAAMRQHAALVEKNRLKIIQNKQLFAAFLKAHPGWFDCRMPRASPVAYPRLLIDEEVGAFCDRLVSKAGIMLAPGTSFDHPRTAKRGHFRIAFGRDDFPENLGLLEQYLLAEEKAGGGVGPA